MMSILTSKLLPVVKLGTGWRARPSPLASYFSRRNLQEFPELKLNNKLHKDYVLVLPEPLNDKPESNEALRIPQTGDAEIDFSKINLELAYKALSQTICSFEDFSTDINNVDPDMRKSLSDFFKDIEQHLLPMDCAYNILSILMTVNQPQYMRKEIYELIERYTACREKRQLGNFKDVIQDFMFRSYSKLPEIDKRMLRIYHPANPKRLNVTAIDDAIYLSFKKHLRGDMINFQQNLTQANQLFSHTVDDPDILAAVTSELDQVTNLHHKERTPLKVDIATYQKFMQKCPDRFVRQMLWQTRNKRCSPKGLPRLNNLNIISNLRVGRRKIADILGYRTHVESRLSNCMISSRQQVLENLQAINEENSDIMVDRLQELNDYAADNSFEDPSHLGIQEYDFDFWSQKYIYEILIGKTEQELKTFFPLDVVLKGMQSFFKNYFDIELKVGPNQKDKFWSPDVQFLNVHRKDQFIGSIVYDPYHKEKKREDIFYARIRGRSFKLGTSPSRLISTSYNLDQLTKKAYLSITDIANLFYSYSVVIQRLLYNYDYYELNTYGCLESEVNNLLPNLSVAYLLSDYRILQSCSDRGSSKTIDAELASRILKGFTHFKSLTTWEELYMAHLDLEAHTVLTDIRSLVEDIRPKYCPFPKDPDNYDFCAMGEIFAGPKDGSKFSDIVSKQLANFCLSQAQSQNKDSGDLATIKSFNGKLIDSLFDSNNLDSNGKILALSGRSFESVTPTLGVF